MKELDTVASRRGLSKTRFVAGTQCHLRLWHDTYARELASPVDEALQAVFDTGQEVGELACRRYPGGHLVAHDHRHVREALDETREVLAAGTVPAVFEAAFMHEGVLVRADVIERLPGGGWRLVEVKSTTRLKDVFVADAAVQLWVLRGAGLDVCDAGVLTLDRSYAYDGERLELDKLFRLHSVHDAASARLDDIGSDVRAMHAMLAGPGAPEIQPGDHCFSPYPCPYHAHCTRDHVVPEHGLDELSRLWPGHRAQLDAMGIREVRDIPDDFPLNRLQRIIRRAVIDGRAQLYGDVRAELAKRRRPVHYLDFETFSPAIPRFAGTRPYDPVPFLFSVHTEREGAPPVHRDYLHVGDDDPRPALADRLLEALGAEGSICTYSGYERQVLRGLAAALPRRARALRSLETRLFDLLPVVRNGYYHPDFRGSFSIKRVLPALVPGLGYDDLSIADGQAAAARYRQALESTDPGERKGAFRDLRAYCKRDTLALVELCKGLAALKPSRVSDAAAG